MPENPLKEAFFGETHLHTSYSLDAFIGGNRNTPEDAYRFARGEEMQINGQPHKLKRPLDFAAVTDHAEFIGEMYSTQVAGAPGYDNPMLVELRGLSKEEEQRAWFLKYVVANNRSATPQHPPFFAGRETTVSAWAMNREVTNKYYEPGKFSTLHGFEWTAAPNGGNMHRNVLFRDDVLPDVPFSNVDSADEEKLWDWIQAQRDRNMKLFAIPHNSNGSKSQMFESCRQQRQASGCRLCQTPRVDGAADRNDADQGQLGSHQAVLAQRRIRQFRERRFDGAVLRARQGQGELCALCDRERHRIPARPRRQSVPVRFCRRHRQPQQRNRRYRGRGLYRQSWPRRRHHRGAPHGHHRWLDRQQRFQPGSIGRRLGREKHPRRDLGCDGRA